MVYDVSISHAANTVAQHADVCQAIKSDEKSMKKAIDKFSEIDYN
jgi:fatty acid/phospholipid biosynthesis enzyme